MSGTSAKSLNGDDRNSNGAPQTVDGNWPSFVYLPVKKESAIRFDCINYFRERNLSILGDTITEEKELHISLSKPFSLRHHQIAAFIDQLGKELAGVFKNKLNLEVYREFYVLNSESKSRSFVCLPVEDRAGTLSKLVCAVDTVLKSFRRAEYYQVPKFHLSVAWVPYNESLETDMIVSVPMGTEVEDPPVDTIDTADNIDVFKYASKYCVSDSSDDEENENQEKEDKKEDSLGILRKKKELQPNSTTTLANTPSSIAMNKITRESNKIVRESVVCNVVECTIGFRTFRLTAEKSNNGKICFEEVTKTDFVEDNLNGNKKRRF